MASGAPRVDRGGCRGNRNQPRDDTGGGTKRSGVTVTDLLNEQPAEHGERGSDRRVQEGTTSGRVRTKLRTGVEAEPAEPQESGAEHDIGQVVRLEGLLAKALADAEHERERQTRSTCVDVDDSSTCEVDDAGGSEPAEEAAAPYAVCDGCVDERDPQDGEDGPRGELEAVSKRTRDQGNRDDGERRLEGHHDQRGDAGGLPQSGRVSKVVETHETGRVADEAAERVGAECEPVAVDHPHDGDSSDADEAHHHHVEHGLRANHAAIEERQRGRHQQHECGRNDHPRGVARIKREIHCFFSLRGPDGQQ